MKQSIQSIFIIFLLSISVSGCSITGNLLLKNKNSLDILTESLIVGKTTKKQIIRILGRPNEIDIIHSGLEVIKYEYKRTVPRLRNFTPIALLSTSWDIKVKQVVILIDEDKIIRNIETNDTV